MKPKRKYRTYTKCPLAFTRNTFRANAKPMKVYLGDVLVGEAKPRENNTGSLGWRYNARFQVQVGDQMVWVQAQVHLTITGSKGLPAEGVDHPPTA